MKTAFLNWYHRYLSHPEAAYLLLFVIGGFLLLETFGALLAPFLISIALAYLLDWPVSWLVRCRISYRVSVWIVFTVFLTSFVLLVIILLPLLSEQLSNLITELPQLIKSLQNLFNKLPAYLPFLSTDQIDVFIGELQTRVAQYGQHLLADSFAIVSNLMTLIVYLVMVPLFVYFLLSDKIMIINWLKTHFVPTERRSLDAVWFEINVQTGNYIRGKVFEMLAVAVVSFITFLLLGLPYALLLASLVGLSVFVPYVGAIVVTIPVLAVGLLEWGWGNQFIYLCIAYGLITALDGNLLVPLLFSQAVALHPMVIIIAILVFGGIWGFWGMFFAIPLAAVVNALIKHWPIVEGKKQ